MLDFQVAESAAVQLLATSIFLSVITLTVYDLSLSIKLRNYGAADSLIFASLLSCLIVTRGVRCHSRVTWINNQIRLID